MTRGLVGRTVSLVVALALAGCSSTLVSLPARHHSSTAGATAASPATSSRPATGSTTTTAAATPPPGSVAHTPPVRPPAGLEPTLGYGTYERCQAACAGTVPASLRRPLAIPADDGGPCPVSFRADGPVSPDPGPVLGARSFQGSAWDGAKVTWTATPAYAGPILIRGRMLGGGGAVGFGGDVTPYDELQLLDAGRNAPGVARGGRAWLTYTRFPGPGCYVYQVDGTDFSEVLVFRAAG
ncbi:MAG: hypothetical protein ACRDMX_03695 [Solirubrobacteraceae bacterium]